MKNPLLPILTALVIMAIQACTTPDTECCDFPEKKASLLGSWQLYEQGYSPGAGYITEEIPATPVQFITLFDDNRFSSNIEGLSAFKSFSLLSDPDAKKVVLSLYENPGTAKPEISNHSYFMELTKENILKLNYRFCIEGCHLAFKPVEITGQ